MPPSFLILLQYISYHPYTLALPLASLLLVVSFLLYHNLHCFGYFQLILYYFLLLKTEQIFSLYLPDDFGYYTNPYPLCPSYKWCYL